MCANWGVLSLLFDAKRSILSLNTVRLSSSLNAVRKLLNSIFGVGLGQIDF